MMRPMSILGVAITVDRVPSCAICHSAVVLSDRPAAMASNSAIVIVCVCVWYQVT